MSAVLAVTTLLLSASTVVSLSKVMCCTVELVHQHPVGIDSGGSHSSEGRVRGNVAELLPLRLHYKVPWPLSMIVDDAVLLKYNQVLIFLLQASLKALFLHHAAVVSSTWTVPDKHPLKSIFSFFPKKRSMQKMECHVKKIEKAWNVFLLL